MEQDGTRALSDVLDRIAAAAEGEKVAISAVVEALGERSFAGLILVFTLISFSPASAIPGLTATVGVIVVLLVSQMLLGQRSVWLPGFIQRRRVSAAKLRKGIDWMRKPVVG